MLLISFSKGRATYVQKQMGELEYQQELQRGETHN